MIYYDKNGNELRPGVMPGFYETSKNWKQIVIPQEIYDRQMKAKEEIFKNIREIQEEESRSKARNIIKNININDFLK